MVKKKKKWRRMIDSSWPTRIKRRKKQNMEQYKKKRIKLITDELRKTDCVMEIKDGIKRKDKTEDTGKLIMAKEK